MELLIKKFLTDSYEFIRIYIVGNLFFSKENRIPAILILNTVIFSLLFTYDYRKKESFGTRKSIGNIVFKKNSVQRKFDNRIVWSTIDINNPVSNKDSIKTEALADAIIKLNDGTEIHIDENTMIFLDFSGFNPTINFKEGSIKIKKSFDNSFFSSKMIIQSEGQTVEIGKSDISLRRTKENLDVYVEKGKAEVISNNTSQKIEEGTLASLGEKDIQAKKISISLIHPPDKIRIIDSGETAEVDFSWNKFGSGEVFLEISRNSAFQTIYKKTRVSGDKIQISIPEGTYYWRVSAISEGKEEHSETRKLIIVTDSQIKIFSPRNKEIIYHKDSSPLVDFHWNKRFLSAGYTLTLSHSPDLKEKTKSYEIDSNSMSLSNLEDGVYYWKITSKSELADIPIRNSSVSQFSIQKSIQVSPVILLKPADQFQYSQIPSNIAFEWEALNTDSFLLQISQESNFKNIVFEQKTDHPNFSYTQALHNGEYYWRVKNLEKGGDFSKAFRFIVSEPEKNTEVTSPVVVPPKKVEQVVEKPKEVITEETIKTKKVTTQEKKTQPDSSEPQVKPRRPTKETEEEREQRRKIELEKFNEYLKM
ncbi:MAG: FecR family protein [Leptospiraceae bacterium]|nr:FecR domain-containing protein [Leptospiraceae bacterium]MCK6381136.1 FecR family protein [Leptospiraceae bacterium]NUM40574.1 FecR domain-containing protein [Leptospiraceae bacterium]